MWLVGLVTGSDCWLVRNDHVADVAVVKLAPRRDVGPIQVNIFIECSKLPNRLAFVLFMSLENSAAEIC